MIKVRTHSPEETVSFAEGIGGLLKAGDVVAYRGGLGAGKTTFTRGLAVGAGLPDEVSSPTFALVNEYRGNGVTMYHFDMYRIMNAEALETTGFYDYMDGSGIIVCEWSENISECLPKGTVNITIEHCGGDEREITVEGDERFDASGN